MGLSKPKLLEVRKIFTELHIFILYALFMGVMFFSLCVRSSVRQSDPLQFKVFGKL